MSIFCSFGISAGEIEISGRGFWRGADRMCSFLKIRHDRKYFDCCVLKRFSKDHKKAKIYFVGSREL